MGALMQHPLGRPDPRGPAVEHVEVQPWDGAKRPRAVEPTPRPDLRRPILALLLVPSLLVVQVCRLAGDPLPSWPGGGAALIALLAIVCLAGELGGGWRCNKEVCS